MIEIGEVPKFKMSYEEAVMYCFCIGDGWRVPTLEEYLIYDVIGWYDDNGWYDVWNHKADKYHVTPVRDLKDD